MSVDTWQQIRDGMHGSRMDIVSSKFFFQTEAFGRRGREPVSRHTTRAPLLHRVCPAGKANHTKLDFFFFFANTRHEVRTWNAKLVGL